MDDTIHILDPDRPRRTLCGHDCEPLRCVPPRSAPNTWGGCRGCLLGLERLEPPEHDDLEVA